MLAYQIVEGVSGLMFIRAGVAQWAVSFSECLAVGTGWIEAEAILPLEEFGEREVVLRLWLHRLGSVGDEIRIRRWGYAALHGHCHQQKAVSRAW